MSPPDDQSPSAQPEKTPSKESLFLWTVLTLVLVGAALGPSLLTQDWSVVKKVGAGAFSGLGVAFLILATRLVG